MMLRDRMSGKAKGNVGHPTSLSAEKEREIVDACILFIDRVGVWTWEA